MRKCWRYSNFRCPYLSVCEKVLFFFPSDHIPHHSMTSTIDNLPSIASQSHSLKSSILTTMYSIFRKSRESEPSGKKLLLLATYFKANPTSLTISMRAEMRGHRKMFPVTQKNFSISHSHNLSSRNLESKTSSTIHDSQKRSQAAGSRWYLEKQQF